MILGLDATRANEPTGVGRTLNYLIRSWSNQVLPFEQVRIFSSTPIPDLPRDERFALELVPGKGSGPWWRIARLRPRARSVDAFFAIYTLPPGFRGQSVVYNLGIYEGPHAIGGWRARFHSWQMAQSARHAARVFVMSPTTKSDLVDYYGVPAGKISVAWAGLDAQFRPAQQEEQAAAVRRIAETLGGREPYFLFVGKPSQRRNVPALIEAFASVASSRDLRLALVGTNTPDPSIERVIEELGVRGRARQVFVDRETLILLYRFARAFVMPTDNDGFSLTILEAMASGLPVVTLRGAPLGVLDRLDGPRDHGDGGPVLEAADARPASLAETMARLADDDELCAELGRRGRRFAETFPSWEETAALIMDSLAEVARAP